METSITTVMGSGLAFPIMLQDGKPIITKDSELIESSIRTILAWPRGSRFFIPTFGSRLDLLIEEPNDAVLTNLLRRFIQESIDAWEPRIELKALSIARDQQLGRIQVRLTYKILSTNQISEQVYPFNTTI